jgi:hypothetical protein
MKDFNLLLPITNIYTTYRITAFYINSTFSSQPLIYSISNDLNSGLVNFSPVKPVIQNPCLINGFSQTNLNVFFTNIEEAIIIDNIIPKLTVVNSIYNFSNTNSNVFFTDVSEYY